MTKKTIGLVEEIEIRGKESIKTLALFDTGAKQTSVDISLASKVKLGPVIRVAKVKYASRKERVTRPVVKVRIGIKGKSFDTEVNLKDRSHMKFPVIIGRNVIAGSFLIDCQKNSHLFAKEARGYKNSNGSE